MHPAYSVILFTTASGAGYGLLALLGLVGINHGQASSLAGLEGSVLTQFENTALCGNMCSEFSM